MAAVAGRRACQGCLPETTSVNAVESAPRAVKVKLISSSRLLVGWSSTTIRNYIKSAKWRLYVQVNVDLCRDSEKEGRNLQKTSVADGFFWRCKERSGTDLWSPKPQAAQTALQSVCDLMSSLTIPMKDRASGVGTRG
jgi:hypothetical protein